jgi:type IV pilus assembly protein PilV
MKRVHFRLKQSAEGGFSLIEVLIGISIFAIGMLAVARMQILTVRNTTVGNLTSQATMLAHQKMEEVKSTAFDDHVLNEVEADIDADGNAGGIYTRTTTINDFTAPSPLTDHARQVQVQVQWNAAHGGNRTVEVNSLTYERW